MAFNFDLPISGGLPPYQATLIKGSLPPGLTLGSAKITGVPTAAKTSRFSIQFTDRLGASVTRAYKVKILAALDIVTKALKPGTSGKAYKLKLKAKAGAKPYDWILSGGTLPLGLTLDSATGKITGIPTQKGVFNLTFQVTDPVGGVAQKTLALTIN